MRESDIETERLAALLDGKLGGSERDELLAKLSSSGDDFDIFAETAAVLREAEEASVSSVAPDAAPAAVAPVRASAVRPVPPSTRASRGWRRPARWVGIAAVLALALSVSVFLRPGGARSRSPERVVQLLSDRAGGLPAGWTARRPWGTALGAGNPLTSTGRAVRVGALHTDLVLAVEARQSQEVARLAAEVAVLLAEVPASAPVADAYLGAARAAGQVPERLEAAGEGAAELLGRDYVELGVWAEAARIAAARRDAGFFRARESGVMLERASSRPDLPPSARAEIERVQGASVGPDWPVLGAALDALLRTLAV
ncbi:MAG TPA: hypothetical protein VF613_17460 [Longimicrobium sp.]